MTPPARETVEILGCAVHRMGLASALERMEAMIQGGGRHHVALVAVHSVMSARRDARLREVYRRASLALADGVSLVLAARLLGRPLAGRVPGADLLSSFSRIAAAKGYTFYLLGSGTREVAASLVRANPGLRVVGASEPPFFVRLPREVNRSIIEDINRAKPDVLWVGLGAPKQDRWIAENLGELKVRVAAGVGAAFDFCSGRVRRAPRWMRRLGLEWFFRFLMEPARLFRRYFVDATPFLPLVAVQRLSELCGPDRRRGRIAGRGERSAASMAGTERCGG